jgi:hypothetical protein
MPPWFNDERVCWVVERRERRRRGDWKRLKLKPPVVFSRQIVRPPRPRHQFFHTGILMSPTRGCSRSALTAGRPSTCRRYIHRSTVHRQAVERPLSCKSQVRSTAQSSMSWDYGALQHHRRRDAIHSFDQVGVLPEVLPSVLGTLEAELDVVSRSRMKPSPVGCSGPET